MSVKDRKRSKAKNARRPTRRTAKTRSARAEEEFTRSLIAHGQAAKVGPDGKLPPGATHELVEDDEGRVKAVRRRFSAL